MKKLILITMALTALPMLANAKGLDYSKPYLKGTIGYARQDYTISGSHVNHFKGDGVMGTVGVGYSWYNNMRAELEFYLDDGISGSHGAGKGNYKSEIKTYAGLFNVAYDFKNSSPVTPFVLAGLGYAKHRFEVHGVRGDGRSVVAKKNHGAFMYQLGAGLGFDIDKNLSLEASYRAINKGTKSVLEKTSTGQTIKHSRRGDFQHAFLLGVRIKL